jgi:glycine C-acetyltransferase
MALRNGLQEAGLEVYGDPSAIVGVKMGTEASARLVSRQLVDLGLVANMVEYPAVPRGAARFRLQVMANHTAPQIQTAVACMKAGVQAAALELEKILQPKLRAVA